MRRSRTRHPRTSTWLGALDELLSDAEALTRSLLGVRPGGEGGEGLGDRRRWAADGFPGAGPHPLPARCPACTGDAGGGGSPTGQAAEPARAICVRMAATVNYPEGEYWLTMKAAP